MLKLFSGRGGYASGLKQGDTVAMLTQLSFLRSGRYNYDSGSLYGRTSDGYYWSGRFYSILDTYGLVFASTGLLPQGGVNRSHGFSLRCLAR